LLKVLARDACIERIVGYCHEVHPPVRSSGCSSVWDGRALWSYGALWRGFQFTVG